MTPNFQTVVQFTGSPTVVPPMAVSTAFPLLGMFFPAQLVGSSWLYLPGSTPHASPWPLIPHVLRIFSLTSSYNWAWRWPRYPFHSSLSLPEYSSSLSPKNVQLGVSCHQTTTPQFLSWLWLCTKPSVLFLEDFCCLRIAPSPAFLLWQCLGISASTNTTYPPLSPSLHCMLENLPC